MYFIEHCAESEKQNGVWVQHGCECITVHPHDCLAD